MSETELLKEVKRLAQMFDWEFYHPWTSIKSASGWPDVALCRPPRLILAELKRDGKSPTANQQKWLDLLGGCAAPKVNAVMADNPSEEAGLEVYLWRPSDLEAIVRTLR